MIGANGPQTIAGRDVRIFEVRLKRELAEEIPHVVPPQRPRGKILPLRKICSIKEEILARPTFFDHFDGVLVDWRYLRDRRIESVREEAAWLGRQGLRVIVDLTSGINSYPDLRLTNELAADYAAGMTAIDDVLAKMAALGARDLVISQLPSAREQSHGRKICRRHRGNDSRNLSPRRREAGNGPSTHLPRKTPLEPRRRSPDRHAGWARRICDCRLAPHNYLLVTWPRASSPKRGKIGLWMIGQPAFDLQGRLWSVHRPIAEMEKREPLTQLLAVAPDAPIVFDVLYENHDAEYLDASLVERLLPRAP